MFALVKQWLREREPEQEGLRNLHTGCEIGFGFIPQKNITGRRLPITEVNSYLFDADSFIAYRIREDALDLNLIVTDTKKGKHYLALSQRVDLLEAAALFSLSPDQWFELQAGDEVESHYPVPDALQGWLADEYRLAVNTEGKFAEGDYRLRHSGETDLNARPFHYVLLVDEENTHALEAERYEDGTITVFVTVYRPASDLGEIRKPQVQIAAPALTREAESEMPVAEAILARSREFGDENSELHPVPTAELPVHSKFGRIQPANGNDSALPPDMLAFETRLAGKIIGEAERNQMPLSELMRKVLDLPALFSEQVFIPFALSDAEYAELARRYDLDVGDREAIKARILEELGYFLGER